MSITEDAALRLASTMLRARPEASIDEIADAEICLKFQSPVHCEFRYYQLRFILFNNSVDGVFIDRSDNYEDMCRASDSDNFDPDKLDDLFDPGYFKKD